MNIYVGNLPYQITEEELKEVFGEFGEVESSKIVMDKYSGRSKGFGFIEMPNDKEAKQAIESLNDTDVKGRNIRVNQARERNDNFRNNDRY
ncbi:MAG: RNA-binding protein [Bacteroidales bacterium]|nr:RNA-binding protein [Bacteroidales bacterium]